MTAGPVNPSDAHDPAEMVKTSADRRVARGAAAMVALVTLTAFAPVFHNNLVNWDDDYLLVYNDRFKSLSGENLVWMFTTGYGGHYQPLTWLSLAVDHAIWGDVPFGYHLGNVVLHLAAAVGFLFVSRRLLTAAMPAFPRFAVWGGATVAALVFAVHPLRVESVAWASERRDVLSLALMMPAVLLYLRAAESGVGAAERRKYLAGALGLYVLSMLAKAWGMTLAPVLLLLDVYPLRRWRTAGADAGASAGRSAVGRSGAFRAYAALPRKALLMEKMLFLVPGGLVALLAGWAQQQAGAMWSLALHSAQVRIAQAFYGVLFYPLKTIRPGVMIALYEQDPQAVAFSAENVLSIAGVVLVTATCVVVRRRAPWALAAWAVYLVLIAPVLGLVQSGPQLVADRYSYVACLPFAVLAGAAAALLIVRGRRASRAWQGLACGAALGGMLLMVGATRAQVRVWRDSETLWKHVIRHAPRTGVAHANLAAHCLQQGRHAEAIEHARQALDVLPGNLAAHVTLGRASMALEKLEEAERHLGRALTIRPGDVGLRMDLAGVLSRMGRCDEAVSLFEAVVAEHPGSGGAWVRYALGLQQCGMRAEALAILERAVTVEPDHAEAWLRLGLMHYETGRLADALVALRRSLRISPEDFRIQTELAWILATAPDGRLRDGVEALRLARRAAARTGGQSPAVQEALAAALAETGDCNAAADVIVRMFDDEADVRYPRRAVRLRRALEGYERGVPFRYAPGDTE